MVAKKATKANGKDDFFKECLEKEAAKYEDWHTKLKNRGVPISDIREIITSEANELLLSIYRPLQYEDRKFFSDTFMAELLHVLDKLRILKIENPIDQLFSQRKSIEEKVKRDRFWGENEPINQTDEELIEFIAKYEYKFEILNSFDQKKKFTSWQQKNFDDLQEMVAMRAVDKFVELEQQFLYDEHINSSGEWISHKNYLVAFIIILKDFGYFKARINEKPRKETDLRRFFEKRYSIVIEQEFQATRREIAFQNEKYKKMFHFIVALK